MVPSIRIDSGITAGTMHQLASGVIRIGSGQNVDVRIPSNSLPPHALTVERRNETCVVHNRDVAEIVVAGTAVARGKSAPWPLNQSIRTCDGTILTLVDHSFNIVSGPATPQRTVDDVSAEFSATDNEVDEPRTKSKTLEISVIAACTVMMAGIVLFRQSEGGGHLASEPLAEMFRHWEGDRQILHRLQRAEVQLGRGSSAEARKIYLEIRNEIVARPGGLSAVNSERDQLLLRYIRNRLSQSL